MSKQLLLGIDIGTSGAKITLFNIEGYVIQSITETYQTFYPGPGRVEQDANEWWRAVCRGIKKLLATAAINPKKIAGIGIAGHSWACLPIDKYGQPLSPAMIWLDRRSVRQVEYIKKEFGADFLTKLNGNPVDPAYMLPKILWLREEKPEIYKKTQFFLQSNSFIGYKLTGVASQDYSQSYGYHCFNIKKGIWDSSVAKGLNFSLDMIPQLYHCHEKIGVVSDKAGVETGLISGIPVVAGGLDAACSTLGAGVIHSRQTQEQGGQAGGMSIVLDEPKIHPKLILGYHVLPDKWLLQGGTVGGGGTLKWFVEQLCALEQKIAKENGESVFEILGKEAAQVGPGSDGLIFLPYMMGERSPLWSNNARGVFFGLSYQKTRAHLIRSIMEGVGFSLLHNLKTAEEVNAKVDELNSVGGASNSRIWTQIKADITGKIIKVPYSDHASSLGAAILAGVGTGVYQDFNEAVARTVRFKRRHLPNPENHQLYQKYYQLYLDLYDNLKDCYETLTKIEFRG